MVDTGAGDDTWGVSGDSGAGNVDRSDGGRAADQTFRGHFVSRSREERGSRNILPG